MDCRRFHELFRFAALTLSAAFAGCAATNTRTAAVAEQPPTIGALHRESARPPGPSVVVPATVAGRRGIVPASFESAPNGESKSGFPLDGKIASAEQAGGADSQAESINNSAAPDPAAVSADIPSAATMSDPQQHLVDMPLVLELVNGQNPQVLYARERINEAMAQLERAETFWLPSIRAGTNWNKHEGQIQQVDGQVITTSRGSYFVGLGSNAVGAGSPLVPGLYTQFHLADAFFQPRIAERTASARQFGSKAATNDALLDAAVAYLELLRAHQERAISLEARENTLQLAKLTAVYASTGQGVEADDDRARAELAVRENDLKRAKAAIQVTSTRLARQLSLDPTLRFEPREPTVVPIELQATQKPLPELVAFGLTHRPEVSESRALAGEAVEKLRREKYAPLVPSVLLGLSYGGLGGGFGSNFVNFGDRLDADVVAWWEIRNLGFGERAARCEAQSRVQQAQWREVAALDRVASEVVEAHTEVEAARDQLATAEEGIRAAQSSYERNLERIRNVQGLPLEALQSIQALAQARREYLRVVVSFNEAQFRLQRALGWPVEAVADVRS